MVQKITGEVPFQVLATNFSISPSTEGYTLQISADGVNYTDLFAVGANVTRMVTGVANGSYYRLSGNNSTVSINWRSQCTDGQSGGGGGEGSQGPMGPMGPQGVQGPAGSGEAGDSHILKVSSSAPSGLSEGDVYALHADGTPREIGSDWTDIGEVSYEWYENYPQAVAIPLNSSEYFSIRFGYATESEGADNGVIVENGELSMDNINGWESDGENSYVLTDDNWMDITSGKTMHVFMDNDVLYFYSDDVEIIWLWTVVEPSDEEHTISTGEITPAVPETMGVYQYNDGTIVELASKDDLPAKINLVPNGEPNYGNILRYNDKPEWVHPSEITNTQLINIETEESAEGSYPQVLKRLNDYDFKWAKQEKRLEAVSALPTTYVEGAVYALANASGYGVYQVQSGTSEMTWVHFDENVPTGWTQARVPYNDDGESNLVGLHINRCNDEINLYWHPEDAENKYWDGVDEQNDGEFTMTDSCGNSISCVRNGDYLVLTFSDPVVYVGETWNHTELYVEAIIPNYVEIGAGAGGGVLVVDSLSSSEAANAPVGSLVGQYKKEGTYLETMPVDSPDVNAEKIVVKGDVNFSNARVQMLLFNGSFYVEFGRSDGKWTKINKGNIAGSWTLDGVDIGASWTGETDGDVLEITDGSNWGITFTKQANGDWLGELWGGTNPHFKYITNLTGSNAFRYEAISPTEANLYMKVSGGTVAHWQGYRASNQTEAFEIIYDDLYDFTTFCDGKIMFSLKYQYGGGSRYAFMDAANQAIVYYSDSAKTTEVARANYLGVPAQFVAETFPGSNYTWVEWKEDGVYFYGKSNNTIIEDLINFHTEGVHFVRITDPTKATASDLGLGDNTTNGIPIWNNEGVIVGKTVGYSTKDIQFNTNASKYGNTGKVTFITNGTNNGPERIFAPLSGGTQGQVLVSDGDNAAPVWTNWVKPVKITSADYEALVTKDPNTLYLIIDE